MNEVMKAILTRRSIRKFTEQPIPEDVMKDIVDAALHAPSGMGKQTWQFTVITNKEVIARLIKTIGEARNTPDYNMYNPTAIILPTNITDGPWSKEDNACALENIFLAAHSHGVGSVWINQMQSINQHPAVRAFLTELGVPADHSVTGLAALGYPAPDAPIRDIERIGKVVYVK